jgi:ubiquinone/menaquinone biosynthesis C-methylase UbiE
VSVEFVSRELSAKYDRFARWYDCVEGVLNFLGVGRLRQGVFSQSSGKVLEVAVGTGKNLRYYSHDCQIIAVDISREMLKVARQRAVKLDIKVHFSLAAAEDLPFPDHCFDTVVSSLSTCTFPNPAGALQEMARVCKPSGQILLLEHGRSDRGWLGRWQDRHADKFAKPFGCHWNREPLDLAKTAGLKIIRSQRSFFGIFHRIEAAPRHGVTVLASSS